MIRRFWEEEQTLDLVNSLFSYNNDHNNKLIPANFQQIGQKENYMENIYIVLEFRTYYFNLVNAMVSNEINSKDLNEQIRQ